MVKNQKRHKSGFRGPHPDVGKATQFKPGVASNPKGRPRSASFSQSMRQLLSEVGDDGKTNAQALAEMSLRKAMAGSPRHLELLMNYVEGRPAQKVELSGSIGTVYQDVSMEALLAKLTELKSVAIADPLHPLSVQTVPLLEEGTGEDKAK